MARRTEYTKAKTCIHAIKLSEHGGLFVKDSCPNDAVMKLPVRDNKKIGPVVMKPYILAKRCEACEFYSRLKVQRKASEPKQERKVKTRKRRKNG